MARSRRRYSRMMNKRRTARRRTARRTNTRRKMRGGAEENRMKKLIIKTLNGAELGVIEKDVNKMCKGDLLKVLQIMNDEIHIKLGKIPSPSNSEQLYKQSGKLADAILIAKNLPDVCD